MSAGLVCRDRVGPVLPTPTPPPAPTLPAPPPHTPDFMAVTFFWPLLLQVTSDFPQVLNFVL